MNIMNSNDNQLKIMGILNMTPDSFSDGGNFNQLTTALSHVQSMIDNGADIIDIGGESTRPNSQIISAEEELKRVIAIINELRSHGFTIPISIDSYKDTVADQALKSGADFINDVWGFQHKNYNMAAIMASHDCYAFVMHNQDNTTYEDDIIHSIFNFFKETIKLTEKAGGDVKKLIFDPGIGFGKTPKQNIEVCARLNELRLMLNDHLSYDVNMLLGTSRKSMIGHILQEPKPKERLNGTLATTAIAIQAKYNFIRVHDVKENKQVAIMCDTIWNYKA